MAIDVGAACACGDASASNSNVKLSTKVVHIFVPAESWSYAWVLCVGGSGCRCRNDAANLVRGPRVHPSAREQVQRRRVPSSLKTCTHARLATLFEDAAAELCALSWRHRMSTSRSIAADVRAIDHHHDQRQTSSISSYMYNIQHGHGAAPQSHRCSTTTDCWISSNRPRPAHAADACSS